MIRIDRPARVWNGQLRARGLLLCSAGAMALALVGGIGQAQNSPVPETPAGGQNKSPSPSPGGAQPPGGGDPVGLAPEANSNSGTRSVQRSDQQMPPRPGSSDPNAARLEQRKAELSQAQATLNHVKAMIRAGYAPQDQLAKAVADVRQREAELLFAQDAYEKGRIVDFLRRPVDIDAKGATVPQLMNTLSKASGIRATVQSAPADLRLTVEAKGVPLGTVLQSIATQANLMISPSANGVVITQWPELNVNGQKQTYVGPNAPWSEEWGGDPTNPLTSNGMIARSGRWIASDSFVSRGIPAAPDNTSVFSADIGSALASRGGWPEPLSYGAAVTPLANRGIVVSEPGEGPKGEAGLWLTIYWLNGTRLDRGATTFHAFRSPSPGAGAPGESKYGADPRIRKGSNGSALVPPYRTATPPDFDLAPTPQGAAVPPGGSTPPTPEPEAPQAAPGTRP